MNKQQKLCVLFVEELRKRGALEDVICEYEIVNIRECTYCHRLMKEGWMYGGYETYCSDKCLKNANPDEDIDYLKEHASDDDSETYWTEWEG